jgi:DNA-binding transcriptional LysR family regulator
MTTDLNVPGDEICRVFVSYCREDSGFLKELITHLKPLCAGGRIELWYDQRIEPGQKWEQRIHEELAQADVVLFLVTASFMASDFCQSKEVRISLQRAERGEIVFFPVIVGACVWGSSVLGKFQALPRKGVPPKSKAHRQILWKEVHEELAAIADQNRHLALRKRIVRPLRLGGATGTGIRVLRAFLAELRVVLPNLPVRPSEEPSDRIIARIARASDDALDAAVVGAQPAEDYQDEVANVEVYEIKSVLVVPQSHALWGVAALSEAELRQLLKPGVVFASRPKDSGTYKAVFKYLEPVFGASASERILESKIIEDIEGAIDCVVRGEAISILPSVVVKSAAARGKKVWAVDLPGDAIRKWYGIWNKHREHLPGIENLIALFKQGIAPEKVEAA